MLTVVCLGSIKWGMANLLNNLADATDCKVINKIIIGAHHNLVQ